VLSFSENNRAHKRALIDRKGRGRVYLDYRSTAVDPRGDSGAYLIYVIPTAVEGSLYHLIYFAYGEIP